MAEIENSTPMAVSAASEEAGLSSPAFQSTSEGPPPPKKKRNLPGMPGTLNLSILEKAHY